MADLKITQLTANTTPIPTDLVPIVDDPAGTAATQKATLGDVLKGGYSRTTYTSDAAPAPTGNYHRNELIVTALATNATIGAPTGTPAVGNMIKVVITATGATRTISYNAALEAGNETRTTSLPAGSSLVQIYEYYDSAWICQFNNVTT